MVWWDLDWEPSQRVETNKVLQKRWYWNADAEAPSLGLFEEEVRLRSWKREDGVYVSTTYGNYQSALNAKQEVVQKKIQEKNKEIEKLMLERQSLQSDSSRLRGWAVDKVCRDQELYFKTTGAIMDSVPAPEKVAEKPKDPTWEDLAALAVKKVTAT